MARQTATELIWGVEALAHLLRHTIVVTADEEEKFMQATIERELTPTAAGRRVVAKTTTRAEGGPYRAPLATFLALAASGRAPTRAAGESEQHAESTGEVVACG